MFQITIRPKDPKQLEILAALFSSMLSEGIQIKEDELIAYAKKSELDSEDIINSIEVWQDQFAYSKEIAELPEVNWNDEWERNFDVVEIEDILTIKARFHNIEPTTRYTITIQPKMSFGTGHHATTWMMVKAMSLLDFEDATVLDAGSGTGILAILASMWKASNVIGFDNDEWSYENAQENLQSNALSGHIEFRKGSLSNIPEDGFDIILANINRNFLIETAGELSAKLRHGGYLIISGFYNVDSMYLLDRFEPLNLVAQYLLIRETWACLILSKNQL